MVALCGAGLPAEGSGTLVGCGTHSAICGEKPTHFKVLPKDFRVLVEKKRKSMVLKSIFLEMM